MSATPASQPLPPQTHIGAVQLIASSLDRSVRFWTETIGLVVHERGDDVARLGAGGRELIVLEELRGATPIAGNSGLYHVALLLPDVTDLARWMVHAARERVPLSGLSDHLVSEAIYLDDPDGHGIEIYRDRPREDWTFDGDRVEMASLPVDTDRLLATLGLDDPRTAEFRGMPGGTTMGHVHFRVAEIAATEAFYRDVLGFDLMAEFGEQAAFLSAGGYHHHVGANVWTSRGAGPAPVGTATLRHATIVLPDDASRNAALGRVLDSGQEPVAGDGGVLVHDPSGNTLLLSVA